MKKILSISLAVLMALSIIGCSKGESEVIDQKDGNAEEIIDNIHEYEGFTFGYDVNEAGRYDITSVKYTGTEQIDIKIPDVIDGIAVTGIGAEAFKANTFIKSVEIPSSVTKIGDWAFWSCISITEITLPDSITEVGKGAFQGCTALTDIKLSSALTVIDDYAFMNCGKLKSISIPATVTEIGEGAFFGCETLTEVVIPASVKTIARGAFLYCYNLKSVTVENAELVFPVAENNKLEGVFVTCHQDLVIKAADNSTAKAYVEEMNKGVIDEDKIDFQVITPTTTE